MSGHGALKGDTPNDLKSSKEKFLTSLGTIKIEEVKATMKTFVEALFICTL